MTDVLTRLLDPAVRDDPYSTYAWLREHEPVSWSERGGVYVLSRHADVHRAFSDPRLKAPEQDELMAVAPRARRHPALHTLLGTMPMTNPPTHTRLHKLVQRDFTAWRVRSLQASVQLGCDALLDSVAVRLRDGEAVDLHEEFSQRLAMNAIAGLLGVPEADRGELAACVVHTLAVTSPASSEEQLSDADAAGAQVADYFRALAAERRRMPGDDLVSALVRVRADDADQLSESELTAMVWALWISGFETSAAAIDTTAVAMVRYPEHAGMIGATGHTSAFVAEALRHETPTILTGVFRIAAEDMTVADVRIPAGSDVRMLPASANRDPAAFPEPDAFVPDRKLSAAVTFGHGIHHCLGANLALMEAAVALSGLRARCPALALADGAVMRPSLTLRTYDRLPVVMDC